MTAEDGFALVAALWMVVLLSLVGLLWSVEASSHRLAAANLADGARGRAAAMAGIADARSRLEQRLAIAIDLRRPVPPELRQDPWSMPGLAMPDTVAIGDGLYSVAITDAGTKLQLNLVTEEELRGLFAALRVDAGAADRIAQAILDWRDPDREHRARGAERDFYVRTGSPALPDDGPFQRVSDLRFVSGITPEIYDTVRPFLTISGSGRVNLNSAERPVLLALPGMTEEAVDVVLRMRRQRHRLANLDELPSLLSSGARMELVTNLPRLRMRSTLETRELEVLSTGWTRGGSTRTAVGALLARGGRSAFVVEWTGL